MTDGKRILYLSYDGLTDPLGRSQILPYLEGLSKAGYNITIISFEKPARYATDGQAIDQRCAGNSIQWIPLTYHKNPPILSTIMDLVVLWRVVRMEHEQQNFFAIHCRSYLVSIIGLKFKTKFNAKFIFDMRGFWADERVEGGLWKLSNPVYKLIYNFFKKREREFIQQADAVISLTEAAKTEIISWKLRDHVAVIPCCVDLALFDPQLTRAEKQHALRTKLGLKKGEFVLLYLGSIGTWYLWKEMVSFFDKLKEANPNAKFLILSPDHHLVESRNDFIVESVTRDEVPLYISLADASICYIKPSFSKKASSATKMAEVLAMDVPIITNPNWGDIDFLKSRVNNLHIVEEGKGFDDSTLKNPVRQTEFFYQFFSLDSGVQKYLEVYRNL